MAAMRLAPPTTLFAHQALNCSNKADRYPWRSSKSEGCLGSAIKSEALVALIV